MKKAWLLVTVSLALASLLSIFLWAAFDFEWWAPVGTSLRGLALIMLHLFALLLWAPVVMEV